MIFCFTLCISRLFLEYEVCYNSLGVIRINTAFINKTMKTEEIR